LLYYTGSGSVILDSNDFKGNTTYDYDDLWDRYIPNSEQEYSYGLYFSNSELSIESSENTFTRFLYNDIGGALYLDKVTFTDDKSEFTQNMALQGGAMACVQCSASLSQSTFLKNYSKRGAAILVQNYATLETEECDFK